MVIDLIETALDIALDDPLVRRPAPPAVAGLGSRTYGHANMLQSAVAASSGAKPKRDVPELRFKDRLQEMLDRVLNNTVRHSRDIGFILSLLQ